MIKINGQMFGNELFDNKEKNYKKVKINNEINSIQLNFENNADLFDLLIAIEYITDKKPSSKIEITMSYVPYSGMDREMGEQLFSLKYLASVLNKFNIEKIYINEPHSAVTIKYIHNVVEANMVYRIIHEVIKDYSPDLLLIPDKGAKSRLGVQHEYLGVPIIYGSKQRDKDGNITKIEVHVKEEEIKNKKVLIIDDLCRKGGTFIGSAKILAENGAKEISLYVTHCDESIFDGNMNKDGTLITKLYTTNSIAAFIKRLEKEKDRYIDVRIFNIIGGYNNEI